MILVAFTKYDSSNMTPLLNENYGFSGSLLATSIVFFGVMGFDFLSTLSDESLNPTRDIPPAMRDSVVYSTGIYILIAISMCGIGLAKN
jgi:amino acid transporter